MTICDKLVTLGGEVVHEGGGVVVGESFEAHGHHSGVLKTLRTYNDDDDDDHSNNHDDDFEDGAPWWSRQTRTHHRFLRFHCGKFIVAFSVKFGISILSPNMITLKKFSGLKNHLA